MNGTQPIFQIAMDEMALPIWQTLPPPMRTFPINLDAYMSIDSFPDLVVAASVQQIGVVSAHYGRAGGGHSTSISPQY